MKLKKWKEPLWLAAFLLVTAILLHYVSGVLRLTHTTYGGHWGGYLSEPENTVDVLFLGSSYAYCGWNPGAVYDETELVSYVMAGSEQIPAVTYWYLRQALKTQSPQVVVWEGSSLLFERYRNHMDHNVCYMPWGIERIMATLEGAPPKDWTGLFFDLYLFHDRWKEFTRFDVDKALTPLTAQRDQNKGHTALVWSEPVTEAPTVYAGMGITEEQCQKNLRDLSRIARYCRDKGVDLIVTVNPTYRRYPQAVYDRLGADVEAAGARFVNWSGDFEGLGLDPAQHLYDTGHLNAAGAKVFSAYTARWLRSLGYAPREQTEENRLSWEETAAYWAEQ